VREGGTSGWRLESARRGHCVCPDKDYCMGRRGPSEDADLFSCDNP
jgi:hypothetical protein